MWRGIWSTVILCLLLVSNEVYPSPSFFGPWPLCPPTSVKITFVSPHLLADCSMYSLPHPQGSFESVGLCLTDLYPFHRHRTHFLLHTVCLRFYETAWDPSTEFFHLAIAILVLSSMLNTGLWKGLTLQTKCEEVKIRSTVFELLPNTSGVSTGLEQNRSTGFLLWGSFWWLALVCSLLPPVHLFYLKDNCYLLKSLCFLSSFFISGIKVMY